MIGVAHIGIIAAATPRVVPWAVVDAWVEDINSTPWDGYTHRLRVRKALLSSPSEKIRLTYKAHPSGTGASTTAVYVGIASDSGDDYDFDGAPVEVTFGGFSGFSLAAGATILSDEIALSLDGTRDILISGQTASGQPGSFAGYVSRLPNWSAWYKLGADAATANASGYTKNLVDAVGVVLIEVL